MLIELESIMWNIMILLINLSLLGFSAFHFDLILDYHVALVAMSMFPCLGFKSLKPFCIHKNHLMHLGSLRC
jgi:hypothetical protein